MKEISIDRKSFLKGSLAAAGMGLLPFGTWAEMVRHPMAGKTLPEWKKGTFRITTLYNGGGEASFLIFPDGTSLLIDCGDIGAAGVPLKPDTSRRPGEWTARWILQENPFGNKVDYFLLTHYHSDHAGNLKCSAGVSKRGDYRLSGIGQVIEQIDFGTMIDRAWPRMDDPIPLSDTDGGCIKHICSVYAEAIKRGTKVERFRLEQGSDQISLKHGGWDGFSFRPLCARGRILRRDGTILDLSGPMRRPLDKFPENPLSLAMVFSHGDFRYYNGGDFSAKLKGDDGIGREVEDFLAPECPQVDVANANHHGHYAMPDSLVQAMRASLIVTGVWHQQHMNRPTMRRLAKAKWPYLLVPGHFPVQRRKADAAEPWLKNVAPESFECAHSVVDVAPDGKTYRLMMVSAADEKRRIVGAYDFKTTKKEQKI